MVALGVDLLDLGLTKGAEAAALDDELDTFVNSISHDDEDKSAPPPYVVSFELSKLRLRSTYTATAITAPAAKRANTSPTASAVVSAGAAVVGAAAGFVVVVVVRGRCVVVGGGGGGVRVVVRM